MVEDCWCHSFVGVLLFHCRPTSWWRRVRKGIWSCGRMRSLRLIQLKAILGQSCANDFHCFSHWRPLEGGGGEREEEILQEQHSVLFVVYSRVMKNIFVALVGISKFNIASTGWIPWWTQYGYFSFGWLCFNKYAHNKQLFRYVQKFLVSTKCLVYKSKLQFNPL